MTRADLLQLSRPPLETFQHSVVAYAVDPQDAANIAQHNVSLSIYGADVRSIRRLQRLPFGRRAEVCRKGSTQKLLMIHVCSLSLVCKTEFKRIKEGVQ